MGILGARDRRRSTSPALLKAGDVLAGKYRVERLLGEGGMGMVVAAHHLVLEQRVAIKLLYVDDDEAVQRLLGEARSVAKLAGEHVAKVIDVDMGENGLPFIVMELLEGQDLGQLLAAKGPLPRWQVVDLILQALEGITQAHVRGIIHRDIKPSNLFLAHHGHGATRTEILKILDFGVSKSIARISDQSFTGASSVLGSPPYMSPEQVRSPKSVDLRTDIWSLGIVMYELLTGKLPFYGEELQATFAQILEKPITPIRAQVNGVPDGLEQVVMRCLAKDRAARYATVLELARDLTPYGSGAWSTSADRIEELFAKTPEDLMGPRSVNASGPMGALAGTPPVGTPLVSDAHHHDFAPTASTVIGRSKFVVNSSGSRGLLVAMGSGLVAALVLIGVAAVVRHRYQKEPEPEVATEVTRPVLEPPPLAPLIPATAPMVEGPVASPALPASAIVAPVAITAKSSVAAKAPAPPVTAARKPPPATTPPPASTKPKGALPAQLLGRD